LPIILSSRFGLANMKFYPFDMDSSKGGAIPLASPRGLAGGCPAVLAGSQLPSQPVRTRFPAPYPLPSPSPHVSQTQVVQIRAYRSPCARAPPVASFNPHRSAGRPADAGRAHDRPGKCPARHAAIGVGRRDGLDEHRGIRHPDERQPRPDRRMWRPITQLPATIRSAGPTSLRR